MAGTFAWSFLGFKIFAASGRCSAKFLIDSIAMLCCLSKNKTKNCVNCVLVVSLLFTLIFVKLIEHIYIKLVGRIQALKSQSKHIHGTLFPTQPVCVYAKLEQIQKNVDAAKNKSILINT